METTRLDWDYWGKERLPWRIVFLPELKPLHTPLLLLIWICWKKSSWALHAWINRYSATYEIIASCCWKCCQCYWRDAKVHYDSWHCEFMHITTISTCRHYFFHLWLPFRATHETQTFPGKTLGLSWRDRIGGPIRGLNNWYYPLAHGFPTPRKQRTSISGCWIRTDP